MRSIRLLSSLSIDALREELHARALNRKTVLHELSDAEIVQTLRQFQRSIYGPDDRQEIFDLKAPEDQRDADSVVALFDARAMTANGDGTVTLVTIPFGVLRRLCKTERFTDQPSGGISVTSGVLVADRIVATAGHCVDPEDFGFLRVVFGFRMRNQQTPTVVIDEKDVFAVRRVERQLERHGTDWALLHLDRPVERFKPARIRRKGKIADGQRVHVIGHPGGLPAKFAGNANVRNNANEAFFVANLDTYGGNSGSPVFNSDTHEVEGILARGERDFVWQETCFVSLVCPNTGCVGEDCTRTTEFAKLVPA